MIKVDTSQCLSSHELAERMLSMPDMPAVLQLPGLGEDGTVDLRPVTCTNASFGEKTGYMPVLAFSIREPRSCPVRPAAQLENLGSLITVAGEPATCLGYLIHFEGRGTYDASYGKVDVTKEAADIHNELLDKALIVGLSTCKVGEGQTFYYSNGAVKTWLGTLISGSPYRVNGKIRFDYRGVVFEGKENRGESYIFFKRIT